MRSAPDHGFRRAQAWINSWPGAIGLGALLAALGLVLVRWVQTRPRKVPASAPSLTLASPGIDAVALVNSRGLELQLYLFSPAAFGVATWESGDSAVYGLRMLRSEPPGSAPDEPPPEREVRATVLGTAGPEDELVQRGFGTPGNQWLRLSGLDTFRGKPYDRFALLRPGDLRPTRKSPIYSLQEGYFPLFDRSMNLSTCQQAALKRTGSEVVETPAGAFSCERYTATIGEAALDVWASPVAGPLGIVRLRSGDEELLLTAVEDGPAPVSIDPVIEPLMKGESTFALGCVSCHFEPNDCHAVTVPAR